MKYTHKKGFTIVELVIVIAVIAILASVLIPTFSNVVDKANRSKALQQAKNAWNDVSYTYVSGYKGFVDDNGNMNGWYYDYLDDVAKYNIDHTYTVLYDGESFVVNDYDSSSELKWDNITTSSTVNGASSITSRPCGLILSYYGSIYSRGFSWLTNENKQSYVYLTESNKKDESDFSDCTYKIIANGVSSDGYYSYKTYFDNLSPSTTYSYKAGNDGNWVYGVFRTESSNPTKITCIQVSDAQTKETDKLNVWENTVAQAIETVGRNIDTILYNGDQADYNAYLKDSVDYSGRFAIARDTVSKYVNSIPYMASAGNHEKDQVAYANLNSIKFESGKLYYSYDYNFAHFVVLNSNDSTDTQVNWLKNDLASASSAKWIIVMMHNGPYATGDHSDGSTTRNIITSYTPVFSEYHVDLVLQGHDHTYNKTLPYKWDAAGYSTTYNNDSVVNFNTTTITINNREYDQNPNGTYYVTTGSAGHRVGAPEGDAGIWADVTGTGKSSNLSGLLSTPTFLDNMYKIEVGKINYSNNYQSFSSSYKGTDYTNNQSYTKGSPATGNINAQMFGVLNMTSTTLTYDFYTVNGNDVKLFDSLNIMKN